MAGEFGAPYREPCGGWPAKQVLHLGGCAQHRREDEDGIDVHENLTKLAGLPIENGDTAADDCAAGETAIAGNCYKLTDPLEDLNLSTCLKRGWKNVLAKKVWHGRVGLVDWKQSCTTCERPETKYRACERSLVVTSSATYRNPISWDVDGSGEPIPATIVYDLWEITHNVEYRRTYSVDPDSGIITEGSPCVSDYEYVVNKNGAVWDGTGTMPVPQLFLLVEDSSLLYLFNVASNPCADPPAMGTPDSSLSPIMGWFNGAGQRTASEQSTAQNYSNTIQSTPYPVTEAQDAEVVLSDSELRVTATNGEYRTNVDANGAIVTTHAYVSGAWMVFPYGVSSWEWEIKVLLTQPCTKAGFMGEVTAMLAEWDLTDDVVYPWRTDGACTTGPLVMHNGYDYARSPDLHSSNTSIVACGYEDDELGNFDGALIGAPLPAGHGPHYSLRLAQWNPGGGIPDTATHWGSGLGAQTDGGWVHYKNSILTAQKFAMIKNEYPSHNWFRPCGADRDAIWQEDPNFCANELAETPVIRFPAAWAICGRIAVAGATNTSPIAITLGEAAPYLRTGDQVTISGVTGNTAANGDWTVTVVDSTHFTLDTSAGNGAFGGGGFVKSAGAPDYQWHDDQRKGDFSWHEYEFDWCENTVTWECIQGCILLKPCCPSVLVVSPNAEGFCNEYALEWPDVNEALDFEENYGWEWHGMPQVVMWDPLFEIPHDDCDTLLPVDYQVPYVEARCAAPEGAPELPLSYPAIGEDPAGPQLEWGCPDIENVRCEPPGIGNCINNPLGWGEVDI